MTILYVASDQKRVGKTALCVTLVHKLRQRGIKATALKVISQTSTKSNNDSDIEIYGKFLNNAPTSYVIKLPNENVTSRDLDTLSSDLINISKDADVILMEASSNIHKNVSAQIVDTLDAQALIVTNYHKNLSSNQIRPWTKVFGEHLSGFVINGLTRHLIKTAKTESQALSTSSGSNIYGFIPESRKLLGSSVNQIAQHLNGRFVVHEEPSDILVEHLMIGGMGMDPAELYFGTKNNKAVIVRGDRPDVQLAALNTSTACLVLTNGIEPIEYVKYEAELEKTSIIVVETNTLQTMEILNTLMDNTNFDHTSKLTEFSQLIDSHFDLPNLYRNIGIDI